uniref:Uncharacterized protein n=1 Tax=Romanomermis culicivorax TaxID=13658 RepID=A0A915JAK1_ROMCU
MRDFLVRKIPVHSRRRNRVVNSLFKFNSMSDDDDSCSLASIKVQKRPSTINRVRRNSKGETPLHVACIRNDVKRVCQLLEEGHPVNVADNLNWRPLHEACNYGHLEIVELLLTRQDLEIDAAGGDEKLTPIMDAAFNGHYEIVDLLLRKGACVIKMDKHGDTLLEYLNRRVGAEDDSTEEQRYLAKIIDRVKMNFKNPKRRKPDTIFHSRFEKQKAKKHDNFQVLRSKRLKNNPKISDEEENARTYKETIENLRKSAAKRSRDSSFSSIKNMLISPLVEQGNSEPQKSSLISEKEFEIQDDWLDDDLNLFPKNKKKNSKKSRLFDNDSDEMSNDEEKDIFDRSCSPKQLSRSVIIETDDDDLFDNECELPPLDIKHRKKESYKPNGKVEAEKPRKSEKVYSRVAESFPEIDEITPHIQQPSTSTLPPHGNIVVSPVIKSTKFVVQIDGIKMMVPILEKDLDKTVGFLAQQTTMKYSSNHGKKPIIHLCNADNVELCLEDPMSLFLNEQLVAKIIEWDLVPLDEKYEQTCKKYGGVIYANLKNIMRISVDSGEINLENCGLRGQIATNLFLALQDSYRITLINLRGNRLTVENCAELGKSVYHLNRLKKLILRNCGLTNEHLKYFIDGFKTDISNLTSQSVSRKIFLYG